MTKMLKIMSQQRTFIPKELINLSNFHSKCLRKVNKLNNFQQLNFSSRGMWKTTFKHHSHLSICSTLHECQV